MHKAVAVGQHGEAESQNAVGAQLQQDAGQVDAAGRGGLRVRQRQPGVQRHQRHFYCETGNQRHENQQLQIAVLGIHRNGIKAQRLVQLRNGKRQVRSLGGIQGMVVHPKHDADDSQQRQHAAGEGEQEEFIGRVASLLGAPNADQKKQRDQREFEEDVEQDDVAGGKDAEHARAQQEQQRVKRGGAVFDGFPTGQHRHEGQQRRQAVDPTLKPSKPNDRRMWAVVANQSNSWTAYSPCHFRSSQ